VSLLLFKQSCPWKLRAHSNPCATRQGRLALPCYLVGDSQRPCPELGGSTFVLCHDAVPMSHL
jgi:hypothetical protein